MSPSSPIDTAWRELEMDALASDGPIRDSDVRNAIRRQRPHIEAQARRDALLELRGVVEGKRIAAAADAMAWGHNLAIEVILSAIDHLLGEG